jgi:hypothetical protein
VVWTLSTQVTWLKKNAKIVFEYSKLQKYPPGENGKRKKDRLFDKYG